MIVRATNEGISYALLEAEIVDLWRSGCDTFEIAQLLNCEEHPLKESDVYGTLNVWLTKKREGRA